MTRSVVWFIAAVAVATTFGCGKHLETTETGGAAFHGLIQYRAKDGKPAIMDPRFVTATEANLTGGTAVIGVVINGQARAYPLYILTDHQIVNDTVAETPLAATW